MKGKILPVLFLGFIFTMASVCLFAAQENTKETSQLNYTLISSRELEHVNSVLRESIKTLLPNSKETYLEYNSRQANKYIKDLEIKFIPYVIYDKAVANSDIFFHMVRHKMVDKVKDYYVIPDEQLKMGEIMLLGKGRKPDRLDMFVGSFCPYSKAAEADLIDFIRQNNMDVDVRLRYLVSVHEFGVSSIYGPEETKENIRQIIIQKYYSHKFWDYLLLIRNKAAEDVLHELEIPVKDIDSRKKEALEILKEDFSESQNLGINRSPTFLWENIYLIPNLEGLKQHHPFNKKKIQISRKPVAAAVAIDFFYSNACSRCWGIKQDFLPRIKDRYKDKIAINYHNTQDTDALSLKLAMEKEYGILKGAIPEVFLPNNIVLEGDKMIRERLATAIDDLLEQKRQSAAKKIISRNTPILDKFSTFSPAVITAAGLIDGINPCAFATLIFFVSLLALNSYERHQIAYVGSTFIISVFLTYLAIGLGIFQALHKLQIFSFLSRLIYYVIALFVLGLGIYNLCDYIRYKKTGQMKGCDLRFHKRLRSLADNRKSLGLLIIATFITGCIVALFEFPCTGQVYFPTIAFVMRVPRLRLHAFFYLVLYNLVFILPLVGVFFLADKGFTSEKFALFTNRHLGGIKIATVILFFSLAIFLFIL